VKEKTNLWRLYNAATAYGYKPSDFFTLETDMAAWQLDEACLLVGRRVEKNLNEGKDAFAGFGDAGLMGTVKRGYRSAKQFVKKKMKSPESGVW
jgi:hypothetical protein